MIQLFTAAFQVSTESTEAKQLSPPSRSRSSKSVVAMFSAPFSIDVSIKIESGLCILCKLPVPEQTPTDSSLLYQSFLGDSRNRAIWVTVPLPEICTDYVLQNRSRGLEHILCAIASWPSTTLRPPAEASGATVVINSGLVGFYSEVKDQAKLLLPESLTSTTFSTTRNSSNIINRSTRSEILFTLKVQVSPAVFIFPCVVDHSDQKKVRFSDSEQDTKDKLKEILFEFSLGQPLELCVTNGPFNPKKKSSDDGEKHSFTGITLVVGLNHQTSQEPAIFAAIRSASVESARGFGDGGKFGIGFEIRFYHCKTFIFVYFYRQINVFLCVQVAGELKC